MQEHHSVRLNVVLASGALFAGVVAGVFLFRGARRGLGCRGHCRGLGADRSGHAHRVHDRVLTAVPVAEPCLLVERGRVGAGPARRGVDDGPRAT